MSSKMEEKEERFTLTKVIVSDFVIFAIVDNVADKVVCHLVYENGEKYCDEMAEKMLFGLNGSNTLTP